jgi:hypothetical protein
MEEQRKVEERIYGKKNHDIKIYADAGMCERINSAMAKFTDSGYVEITRPNFLRLAVETFCQQVLMGEVGITIRTKKGERRNKNG